MLKIKSDIASDTYGVGIKWTVMLINLLFVEKLLFLHFIVDSHVQAQ